MSAKQGFDWKKIENKPDNWETIRELIKDAVKTKTKQKDKYWDNNRVLEIFLEMYPSLSTWIKMGESGKKSTTNTKKKDQIIEKQTVELIKNDLRRMTFDKKTQGIVNTNFTMDVTFVLMLLLWNFMFWERKRRNLNINQVSMIDAIISLNRINADEREYFSDTLALSVDKALADMNGLVDVCMYDCLFNNPYLLIQSVADKRPRNVRLYPEQHKVLDLITEAVREDRPILLGNQMPTGTGKTMLAVPLAQKMFHMRLKKTVLFACSNELVNQDLASMALLADDLHLWLARLIRDEKNVVKVLLRPYKRCFPAVWKKVYKQDDKKKNGSIQDQWEFYRNATRRNPDMIIADLEACEEILKVAGEMENPFVAYIDEFISDERSNQLMKTIGKWLPRQSVIISAILPPFENISRFVRSFCDRHDVPMEDTVHRVDTAVVNISCAIINHEGRVCMPHHQVETLDDMRLLLQEIKVNPRIRRAYTAKHVYYWSKSLVDQLRTEGMDFHSIFPNIGTLTNSRILDYAISILEFIERNNLIDTAKQYKPVVMDTPSLDTIFTTQAHFYEGKTLIVADNIYEKVIRCGETLFQPAIRWNDLVVDAERRKESKQRALETLKKKMTKEKSSEGGKTVRTDATDMALTIARMEEMDTGIQFPNAYVINSREHVMRCNQGQVSKPRQAVILSDEYNTAFEPELNLLLSAGVGIYDIERLSDYQRRLVMDRYSQLAFLCSGKEIVFGTNLPDLTNIFIDASFGEREHPNVLYQLMGRAGRLGRSYHANIILNSSITADKILDFRSIATDPVVIDFDTAFA